MDDHIWHNKANNQENTKSGEQTQTAERCLSMVFINDLYTVRSPSPIFADDQMSELIKPTFTYSNTDLNRWVHFRRSILIEGRPLPEMTGIALLSMSSKHFSSQSLQKITVLSYLHYSLHHGLISSSTCLSEVQYNIGFLFHDRRALFMPSYATNQLWNRRTG